jgi:hypothetical protein
MGFDLVGKEKDTMDKELGNINRELIILDTQINFDRVRGRLDEFITDHKRTFERLNKDLEEIKNKFDNKFKSCTNQMDKLRGLLNS